MEKYGFVYIWRDKKHNRYYIGSHWGTENDGYTTGQAWSRNAIKCRPQDFRRKILDRGIKRKDLLYAENCWLWFIEPEELGKRYYNLNRECRKHWHTDERSKMDVKEKLRVSTTKLWQDPKYRKYIGECRKGCAASYGMLGKKQSEYQKRRASEASKGRTPWNKGLTKEMDERVARMYKNG